MGDRRKLGDIIRQQLEKEYTLTPEDIGGDAHLSRKGMTFETQSYTVEGLGHLCVLNMKAMLGLMKMETVVLSVFDRDVPLVNLDWISAFGKETQLNELYDTQIAPYPQEKLDEFSRIKEADSELTDYVSAPSWYDGIKYDCSYHKTGKKISQRLSSAAAEYIAAFADQLKDADICDPEIKKEKIRDFACTLVQKGGPAVNQFTGLFGKETAERLILKHMYGVK